MFHTPRQKEAEWRAARLKFLSREGDHLTLLNVFRGFMELPKVGGGGGGGGGGVNTSPTETETNATEHEGYVPERNRSPLSRAGESGGQQADGGLNGVRSGAWWGRAGMCFDTWETACAIVC